MNRPTRLSDIDKGKSEKPVSLNPKSTKSEYRDNSNLKAFISNEQPIPIEQSKSQGQVTAIAAQKKAQNRFNLYIDNQFYIGIGENTLVHFVLAKGQVLSKKQLEEVKQYELADQAYQLAVHYLSYQLRSKKEIYDKLLAADYSEEMIHKALNRLIELHLIDDVMYGKSYVRTQMRVNRKGPAVIKQELKQKGLKEEEISQAITEYPFELQLENASTLGIKQFNKQKKRYSLSNSEQKVRQYLLQKGFSYEIIQQVLNEISVDQKDQQQEMQALIKEGEKLWRRAHKLAFNEKKFKVKSQLYRKGYPIDKIDEFLGEMSND